MFRKFVLAILIIPAVLETHGQKNHQAVFTDEMAAFSWNINVPISNDFTNKTSFDGARLDYRKMIKPDLSVGLEMSWYGYDQYIPVKTYQIPHGAVTTDFYDYMYVIPVGVNAHHYFHFSDLISPYAGLALGATYSEDKLYYNTYVSSYYNWGFMISPEIGAVIKFTENSGVGILVGVNYSYSTNKQKEIKINGLQSLGFQIGFVGMK
jgi:hypothetical protein